MPARLANPDATLDERELVQRLRNGETKALGQLVAAYIQPLRDFAYLIVRDADLAHDVAQDVFVYVWEHRDALRPSHPIRGYLYRATRNRALDVLKHERAQARVRDVGQSFVIDAVAESADAGMAMDEFAAAVQTVLGAMTPRVREILLMSRVHAMSTPEIAQTLELSVPTVKSQLSRALKQLAQGLDLTQ